MIHTLTHTSDEELEETALIYLHSIKFLMQSYAEVYTEGTRRKLPSFDSIPELLTEEEQQYIREYVKKLSTKELIQTAHQYKTIPSWFNITLNEIKSRLDGV